MAFFKRNKAGLDKALRIAIGDAEPPTFPALHLKILKTLRDPNTEMAQVGEALQWDPGLVVRVLTMVNSASYGAKQPIRDAGHAAAMLGRSELEQIVIGMAVGEALPSPRVEGFEPLRFWTAAATRAALARTLASRMHPARQADAFTAGLLQDLAVPVLAAIRPDEYGPLLVRWHSDPDANLQDLEEAALGFNHATIGAALGARWGLPEGLSEVIACHHKGDSDIDYLPAVRLVSALRESDPNSRSAELIETAHAQFGLDPDWTRASVETAGELASEIAETLVGKNRRSAA